MTLTVRSWLYLACLWLSIATALGHAVAPVGSPLDPVSGSAFSASTTDVALAPARNAPAVKRAFADSDPGVASDAGPALTPHAIELAPVAAYASPPTPSALQPPPSLPRFQGFHARAPPRG